MENKLLTLIIILSVALVATIVVLYFLQKLWCYFFGRKAIYLSGWIGTPVHELSHVAVCLLFRHKVLEISLFKPEPETGVLGYVTHSFDPTSFYQRIGCLFIGLAPLVGNLGLAYLIYMLFISNSKYLEEPLYAAISFYVITCLVLHAAPSPADLKGAATGLVTLAIVSVPIYFLFPEFYSSIADTILTKLDI